MLEAKDKTVPDSLANNMAANFQSSSTQTEENFDDYLINSDFMCEICRCEYDLEIRKPKFLPCSHTLCLLCLQNCCGNGEGLKCMICQKDHSYYPEGVADLPDNPHIIHLLKFPTNGPPIFEAENEPQTSSMLKSTMKDLENLFAFNMELEKLKGESSCKITEALIQRRKVNLQLEKMKEDLNNAKLEVENLKEENKIEMDQLEAQVNLNNNGAVPEKKGDESLISNVIQLMKDAEQDETLATLRLRMEKKLEESLGKLEKANDLLYQLTNSSIVSIQLSDGVGSVVLNSSSDSLLSYFVYDLLKRESAATDEESGLSDEEDDDLEREKPHYKAFLQLACDPNSELLPDESDQSNWASDNVSSSERETDLDNEDEEETDENPTGVSEEEDQEVK